MERNKTAIKSAAPIGIYDEKGKLRPGFYEPGSLKFDDKYRRFRRNRNRGAFTAAKLEN